VHEKSKKEELRTLPLPRGRLLLDVALGLDSAFEDPVVSPPPAGSTDAPEPMKSAESQERDGEEKRGDNGIERHGAPSRNWTAWIANIGLALFLTLEMLLGISLLRIDQIDGEWNWVSWKEAVGQTGEAETVLWLVVTPLLAWNVLRRPPPSQSDARWWVWIVCGGSLLHFLLFDQRNSAFWGVVFVNLVSDFALIYLGKSFSILPARREIRTEFAYSFVRHPVYLTYLVADLFFLIACYSFWNLLVVLLGAMLFALRAELEEQVLRADPRYQDYARRVRWRFLPGVY